jgi:hypothetical protein
MTDFVITERRSIAAFSAILPPFPAWHHDSQDRP